VWRTATAGGSARAQAAAAPAVVYVACDNAGTVTPITVATRKAGPQIAIGAHADLIAITPDGATA
jgi:hypothetical protein